MSEYERHAGDHDDGQCRCSRSHMMLHMRWSGSGIKTCCIYIHGARIVMCRLHDMERRACTMYLYNIDMSIGHIYLCMLRGQRGGMDVVMKNYLQHGIYHTYLYIYMYGYDSVMSYAEDFFD